MLYFCLHKSCRHCFCCATSLTGTELDVIIEPKGGHGKDAVDELGGFFVMTNTNFEGAETSNSGDFNTTNDFRRVSIIKDPNSGGSAATATTLRGVKAHITFWFSRFFYSR